MHAATLALLLSLFLRAASVHVVEHHSTWRASLAAEVLVTIDPAVLRCGLIHIATSHRAVCALLACLCFVLDRGGRDPGALWWALLQLASAIRLARRSVIQQSSFRTVAVARGVRLRALCVPCACLGHVPVTCRNYRWFAQSHQPENRVFGVLRCGIL